MWSKKKKKEGWHLSDISGMGPITAPSRTHALWHQVSLCALQTRPRPPGPPPRALPPPGVTEKVRREIIITSFASHLATSQVRAEPRCVPKNSRGQARSSVCPDGPDEPGGGIYSARCWQGITFQRLGWSLRRQKKKKDNNKICAIYLLEQSGVGNFSCVKYRAKFVFLHSSLAKMPCGGRVDKLTVCQTNRAFSWGTCLIQREVNQQHFHFEYCTNVCEVSCM